MNNNRGFTLIELMIAMGIFSIFLVIIMGVFSRFVATERHNIAYNAVISDVQSSLESFAKEVRTGYGSTYFGDDDGSGVAFRNQAGVCVIYRAQDGVFERGEDLNNWEEEKNCTPATPIPASQFAPLTSNQTEITDITITAEPAVGVGNADGTLINQGSVAIELTANSAKEGIAPLTIQRTITSRQMSEYKTITP